MRLRKLSGYLSGFLIICTFASSCDNDIPPAIQPSTDSISMEGEGGEAMITFHNGDWIIDRIENRSADDDYISGDIYSLDGTTLAPNTQLQLSGLGKLVSSWDDHGFTITRERTDVLSVSLHENWTENDFIFAVILQAGTEEKEIIVTQKKSQGYTFSKIEYIVKEEDGDTFDFTNYNRSYPNSDVPTSHIVLPFTGVEDKYQYIHDTPEASYWQQQTEISVPLPVDIDTETGEVTVSDVKYPFSANPVTRECAFMDVFKIVDVPAGFPIITVRITFRKRQISYYMTLINNRTGAEKIITGKWLEEVPTGEYHVTAKSYSMN